MRITIPDILKVQLVDDWENVTKNSQVRLYPSLPLHPLSSTSNRLSLQLVTLPRKPTVAELLEDFQSWANTQKDQLPRAASLLPTVTAGLRLYFDRALGSKLLYRFERPQYHTARRNYITGSHVKVGSQKEMSEIYGAEHLLRMICMFYPPFFFSWCFCFVIL